LWSYLSKLSSTNIIKSMKNSRLTSPNLRKVHLPLWQMFWKSPIGGSWSCGVLMTLLWQHHREHLEDPAWKHIEMSVKMQKTTCKLKLQVRTLGSIRHNSKHIFALCWVVNIPATEKILFKNLIRMSKLQDRPMAPTKKLWSTLIQSRALVK